MSPSVIPKLPQDAPVSPVVPTLLSALQSGGFTGDIETDYAARLAAATDNSIYEVLPAAVLYPRHAADVEMLLTLLADVHYRTVSVSARGGGTGTNGQSLTAGLVLDYSRYMNQIVDFDEEERVVTVQPGVVLDQLNQFLSAYDLWFPPNLSPSNRATLGGMFSTDASGKGSCYYGRTSDYVLSVEAVLPGGRRVAFGSVDELDMISLSRDDPEQHHLITGILNAVKPHQTLIDRQFPCMPRTLTGYNLAKAYDGRTSTFHGQYLLSGSEGTLAMVTALRLAVEPKVRHEAVVAVVYRDFDSALRSGYGVLDCEPTAVETIDDNIVRLAAGAPFYEAFEEIFATAGVPLDDIAGINLIAYDSDNIRALELKLYQIEQYLKTQDPYRASIVGYHITQDANEQRVLWNLRKQSVGLLANQPSQAQPIPFVEDTAVPPDQLADYIQDFRALLDQYGLRYGMFGHVDAGCLHVRPALDLQDPRQAALVPLLTDQVCALVKSYGGLLWGEHGRGYRASYTAEFFGETLYGVLREIKTLFDPNNQLNPGKIVPPQGDLYEADIVPVSGDFRGTADATITPAWQQALSRAMRCNGNAACLQYDVNQVMCPSHLVTQDRVHSPKVRASLLRKWAMKLSEQDVAPSALTRDRGRWGVHIHPRRAQSDDFSDAVYQALSGCLGCKACASSCPVQVDIPQMKSVFLAHYHTRYRRNLRDVLVANLERFAPLQARFGRLSRRLMNAVLVRKLLEYVGLYDLPQIAPQSLKRLLLAVDCEPNHYGHLAGLSQVERHRTVCLVTDVLSAYYEPMQFMQLYDLLTIFGYRVVVLPFRESGKLAHSQGYLGRFHKIARANATYYGKLNALGIPVVGVDPSLTLVYRDEYRHAVDHAPKVHLLQEWLDGELTREHSLLRHWLTRYDSGITLHPDAGAGYALMLHCSESTKLQRSGQMWSRVFAAFGLDCMVMQTGCCGMAGTYGLAAEHQANSRAIFEQSWAGAISQAESAGRIPMATGFSCQSQVLRMRHKHISHPLTLLHQRVKAITLAYEPVKRPAVETRQEYADAFV